MFQDDIKRMLAYSSVAQIGYITLGIALASQTGLTGGIVHLANHAMTKAALFLLLGAVVYRIGACKIDDMSGLAKKMPVTMGAFVIAGLGIIGTPGTAGFISQVVPRDRRLGAGLVVARHSDCDELIAGGHLYRPGRRGYLVPSARQGGREGD